MSASVEAPLFTATGETYVRDAMAKTICSAQTEDTIRDIAQMMAANDTGFVPIVDGDSAVGVVTDRDIVLRCVRAGHTEAMATKAWEIMSKPVIAVYAADTLDHAGNIMAKHQVRRLPVIDRGKLVGVLSFGNLVQALHGEGAAQFAALGVTRGA